MQGKVVRFVVTHCLVVALGVAVALLLTYIFQGPSQAMLSFRKSVVNFEFLILLCLFMLPGMLLAQRAEAPFRRRFPIAAPFFAVTLLVIPFTALAGWVAIYVLRHCC